MTKAHGERDVIIQAGQKREVLLYQKHNRPTTAEALLLPKHTFQLPQLAFCQKRSQRIIGDTIKLL